MARIPAPVRPLPANRQTSFQSTFRALRHRNYRLWFLGQGLSLIGTWMQMMAQQVLVYRLTGSAAALGIVSFMDVLPLVPLALWAGSLSDRMPKRTLILCTQTAMLLQALVLGILAWAGLIQAWHVYVLALLLGVARSIDMPVRHAFVVEMVEGKEDLAGAIGLNSTIYNAARILGPAVAGVGVAAMGEAIAFFINAISFVAVILALSAMRILTPANTRARPANLIADTAEGIRFVFRDETLRVLVSLVAVSSFLSMPYNALMPVFANLVLKESAAPLVSFLCGGAHPLIRCVAPEALPLGLLLAALGVGAITGALTVASLPARFRRGRVLTIGNLCFPLCLLGFAASRSMVMSMGILLLIGISFTLQNALANTLLQMQTPDHFRGRVMSLYAVTSQGMQNVGSLQAGVVADWVGAPLTLAIGAALSLAYGLYVAVRFPRVRELS